MGWFVFKDGYFRSVKGQPLTLSTNESLNLLENKPWKASNVTPRSVLVVLESLIFHMLTVLII